jgi:hypothetical protein
MRSAARSKVMWVVRATVFLVGLAVILALLSMVSPAWADSFIVSNTNDSGEGSLRQAIIDANANVTRGEETITFAPNVGGASSDAAIELKSALPQLSSVRIEGPGAHRLTVRQDRFGDSIPRFRIFTVASGATVSIEGLTISLGAPIDFASSDGGGILNPASATLTITNSIFSDNRANKGGAIHNAGTLTLEGSTVCNNMAPQGGGIYNAGGGVLTVTNSTVCANSSDGPGGVFNAGTLTVEDGTFSGNDGGGGSEKSGDVIHNAGEGAKADIKSATITANVVGVVGRDPNTSPATIYNAGTKDKLILTNSIIADNSPSSEATAEVRGTYTDGGFNLIGGDPKLGALQENGGLTKTHLPLAGSPALDKGASQEGTTSTDQRGVKRPHDDPLAPNANTGDGSDIGAVEAKLPEVSIGDVRLTEGTGGTTTANFSVRLSESEVPARYVTVDYSTHDDEATSPTDYSSASGTLQFTARGDAASKTIAVAVQADAIDEPTETFLVDLTSSEQPEYIADGSALGIIRDDDVNSAPVAVGDSYIAPQDKALRVAAPGLLSNDTDPDGNALTATEVSDPPHGEVFVRTDGSFAYLPDDGYLGADSFTYKAKDGTASSAPATVAITVKDLTKPTVIYTEPLSGATGVSPSVNVTANFSEAMRPSSINTNTFKLYRVNSDGSTTQINDVVVTLSSDGLKATLDPFPTSGATLSKNTKFKAVVTTGARDVAGNFLDQAPKVTGNQGKEWFFTTSP